MDNIKIIDALADACEEAVAALHSGQHIRFCQLMYGMVVRLAQLKSGIIESEQKLKDHIETLKKQISENDTDGKDEANYGE